MPDKLKARREKFKTASKAATGAPSKGEGKAKFGSGRVSRQMKTQFSVQFATLQEAGLPVLRSLKILSGQMPPGRFKSILSGVTEDVEGGSPLSESLAKHPKVFDSLYVNVVRAGEAGGMLTQVFNRLADFMERSDKLIRRVKGALAYPVFVVFFAVAVVTFIMIVIVPQFEEIFSGLGEDLPAPTRFLINTSKGIATHWYLLILVPLLIVGLFKLIRRSPQGRFNTDKLVLKMPLLGTLIRKTQVARFSRTLGTLSSSGVALLESLEIVKGTSTNEVVRRTIDKVRDSVSEGETIAQPLGESGVFDDMVVNMVDVGEETGELDKMLMKVADRYDDEVDSTVSALLSILEPMLIVVMGIVIGFIVIALFMPLLELQSKIGG
ncbi:MAG: type II secretion system F family protein [Planctomycetes bacterium]|nr:type II secretion system F family protein [Planctomycetota bacterium]